MNSSIWMKRITVVSGPVAFCICFLLLHSISSGQEKASDWKIWRGPNANGIALDQKPPVEWSDRQNVLWKAAVPGRGHASPTVVENQVILGTADNKAQKQWVISYDFDSGTENWKTLVNEGAFNPKIYPTNTHASSTVVSDGERLFAVFNNHKSAQLTVLDLNGKILWQKNVADFTPKAYQFGFGASPVLYEGMVIVSSECEKDGEMVALDVESGDVVWKVKRDQSTSYSTPSIANIANRVQLIISGGNQVDSYDPKTGKSLWSVQGPWLVTCGTPVWDENNVYVSGGFPASRTMAIKADGSGEVVWENAFNCYEQSMLLHDGYLYGSTESAGFAFCIRTSDGKVMWQERMDGKVSASPVLADGKLFMSAENGTTWVIEANPEKFNVVAKNKLGTSAYATPTILRNKILLRVSSGPPNNQSETLYCIGQQ
ncbi:MAG: PQQ-binding-like beta-propeller repeat protein [Pirellulaceae bacterium]